MIACFGASVTQQNNGYSDKLSKLINQKILKYGYGGMHICDAGICFIDEVVNVKPDICIIDWFSTDYQNEDGLILEYIKTIVQKLNTINCRVIFLLLPNRNVYDWESYYLQLEKDLKNLNLEFISIYKLLSQYSNDLLLRDTIHTTEFGAELYAKCIKEYLDTSVWIKNKITEVTKFTNIKTVKVKKVFKTNIKINGDAEIIGLYNILGRHSGLVRVKSENYEYVENLWDEWAYYPRYHFNLHFLISKSTEIEIMQNVFDTTKCEKMIDFSKYKKCLVLESVYFIGDNIKLITKGSAVLYYYRKIISLLSRIIHIVYRVLQLSKNISLLNLRK